MKIVPILAILLLTVSCSSRYEGQAYNENWDICNDDAECIVLDPGQCAYTANSRYADEAKRYYYPNGLGAPLCVEKSAASTAHCVHNKCEPIA